MPQLTGDQTLAKKNLTFAEAINYAQARKIVLPDVYYNQLMGVQRSQAVSVAGMTSVEQVKFIVDQLDGVLKNGGTFKDFQKAVANNTLSIDLPVYRLDNIFRTNIQAAYNRGRWEQQAKVSGSRPYLMYDAINDGRTRPSHHAMDGFIGLRTDPFWSQHYPPNGYRCRCTVISLTTAQAQKRGISQSWPTDAEPDEGWDYNPGADYQKPIPDLINKTLAKATQTKPHLAKKADVVKKAITKKATQPTLDSVRALGKKALAELDKGDYNTPSFHRRVEDLVVQHVTKAAGTRAADKPITALEIRTHAQKHLGNDVFKMATEVPMGDGIRTDKDYFDKLHSKLPLPSTWLKAVKDYYPKVKVEHSYQRAFARQGRYDATLSLNVAKGDTVLHEFLHLVQVAKPEIQAMAEDFHNLRTQGAARKRLKDLMPRAGHEPHEVAKEDHYFAPYMGREYADGHDGDGFTKWRPWEILTMSVQALLGDVTAYSNKWHGMRTTMFAKDRETAEFALGLLLSYA